MQPFTPYSIVHAYCNTAGDNRQTYQGKAAHSSKPGITYQCKSKTWFDRTGKMSNPGKTHSVLLMFLLLQARKRMHPSSDPEVCCLRTHSMCPLCYESVLFSDFYFEITSILTSFLDFFLTFLSENMSQVQYHLCQGPRTMSLM